MSRTLLSLLLCAMCACAYAQEKRFVADLQTVDDGFFDPTKKDTKQNDYQFKAEYRLEIGYTQPWQQSKNKNYPDGYLHGGRVGLNVTFCLPYNFGVQTGLIYSLTGNKMTNRYAPADTVSTEQYISNTILEHNLVVPMRVTYTIPLWKKLNLVFYGGPQLQIGLAMTDKVEPNLSAKTLQQCQALGVPTESYDKYTSELWRANIQMGLGAALEWDKYRLQGGYDFGLNNMVRTKVIPTQQMWEWGWYISFLYRF